MTSLRVLWPSAARLSLLVSVMISTTTTTWAQVALSTSCDYTNDTCPFAYDNVCDFQNCPNGDCYDCDPCQQFRASCGACVTAGCHWCAANALCLGTPWTSLEEHFVNSCGAQDQWVSGFNQCPSMLNNNDNNNITADSDTANNNNVFTDPLYDSMAWSYDMIHVPDVWRQGIFGTGVRIRINDNGVDANHAEFLGGERFDVDASCGNAYLPPDMNRDFHGTAVASVVAGGHDNGQCAVGIAPEATLSACWVPEELQDDDVQDETPWSRALSFKLNQMDVSVNTFLPDRCMWDLFGRLNGRRQLQQGGDTATIECPFTPPVAMDPETNPCQVCATAEEPRDCERASIRYCALFHPQDPVPCGEYLDQFTTCEYHALPEASQTALVQGVTEGRDGKGIIYIFPAGNGGLAAEDVNMNGYTNSRFTIAVGGVDRSTYASYSTPGAAVLVSAPSGDERLYASNNMVARPGGGCTDAGDGTSFAAAVAAGVVALMLEVRPELTWRDVQGILAGTAQTSMADMNLDDGSWSTNAAGVMHSINYGFGVIDASAAVEAAKTWTLWGPELEAMAEYQDANLTIVDDSTVETTSTIAVEDNITSTMITESVDVYVQLVHPSRGDLEVTLTSPGGTTSVLHPGQRPENASPETNDDRWQFLTLRHWGESPVGEWTLTLTDKRNGMLEDCTDLFFEHQNGFVTCESIVSFGDCGDGEVLDEQVLQWNVDGLTADVACCGCGGGSQLLDGKMMLQSWGLVAYGHAPVDATTNVEAVTDPSDASLMDSSNGTVETVATSQATEVAMGNATDVDLVVEEETEESAPIKVEEIANGTQSAEDEPSPSPTEGSEEAIAGSSENATGTESSKQESGACFFSRTYRVVHSVVMIGMLFLLGA